MKLSLTTLAASIAVASAADCDITKLSPLLSDPKIATCTADSGYSFTALAAPTADILPKLCASTACKSVLAAVKGLGLGDCTLLGMKLETDLITPTQTACASALSTMVTKTVTATGSTSGSTSGTATVGASSNTTKSPSTTSSNSTSSAAGISSDEVKSPSTATTPAPTTKKSSATSIAIVTSAVVLALAASFF